MKAHACLARASALVLVSAALLGPVRAQEITVIADAPRVETESSEQSSLISGDPVRELPLNGRFFITLIELLPGWTPTPQS